MNSRAPTDRDLLEAALSALNQIRNHRISNPAYASTYKLAAAIEKHLATPLPAQKTLDQLMQEQNLIGHLWSIEDVQAERPDLND